ncbi:MAG: hypothetical protein VR72_04145 [Clostridiaceae bacterium BRH_c20a]|nr:MAG: hypothetical protein VR72_04145 [Clostridiaceae bacterium BRH_c20a]
MKRVKFLAITMVMALMIMGVGYAYWQDTITLTSTVKTGEFDVQWKVADCSVDFEASDEYLGADVAQTTAVAEVGANPDELAVTISNLFPGATGTIKLYMENYGTVPSRFQDATFTLVPADGAGSDFNDFFVTKFRYKKNDGVAVFTEINGGAGTEWIPVNSLPGTLSADAGLKAVVLAPVNYAAGNAAGQGMFIEIPFEFANQVNGLAPEVTAEQFEETELVITMNFDFEQWIKN